MGRACEHDDRFGEVFFAKNGCVACELEEECRARKDIDLHAIAEQAVQNTLAKICSIYHMQHEKDLVKALAKELEIALKMDRLPRENYPDDAGSIPAPALAQISRGSPNGKAVWLKD